MTTQIKTETRTNTTPVKTRLSSRQIALILFKSSCLITVIIMIGYWMVKYENDEDICLVDYQPIRKVDNIDYPEVSICFEPPFLDETLQKIDPNINSSSYIEYLKGNKEIEKYKHIEYNNVSINLDDYFQTIVVTWKNNTVSNINDTRLQTSFTGWLLGSFVKCFSLEISKINIGDTSFVTWLFDPDIFHVYENSHSKYSGVMLHYPNQMSLAIKGQYFPPQEDWSNGIHFTLDIKGVEILKRRNKNRAPCTDQWRNFDQFRLRRHIEKMDCKSPYQSQYEEFAICSRADQIQSIHGEQLNTRSKDFDPPCQEMPRVDYELFYSTPPGQNVFMLAVKYPDQAKVITQSRAIDVHSLLGNIGGYIGLFLGRFNIL